MTGTEIGNEENTSQGMPVIPDSRQKLGETQKILP